MMNNCMDCNAACVLEVCEACCESIGHIFDPDCGNACECCGKDGTPYLIQGAMDLKNLIGSSKEGE